MGKKRLQHATQGETKQELNRCTNNAYKYINDAYKILNDAFTSHKIGNTLKGSFELRCRLGLLVVVGSHGVVSNHSLGNP